MGSALALVAVGLVLTYRASGVLNFAHGALAIVAVDFYVFFTVNRGWSWEVGSVLAVLGVGTLMGLALEPLGRLLVRTAPALRVVATIGLLIAIQAGSILISPHLAGSHPHFASPPMPVDTVYVAGVYVGKDQIIVTAVALLCALGLWAFLRRSRLGIAMRAVVSDPDLVDLTGNRAVTVRRVSWVIAAVFAALSGVLLTLSPTMGGGSGTVNQLIVPSFGAAAIAMFTSLPLAYVGGLVIGVVTALLTNYVRADWLIGLPSAAPYLILLAVLLVVPRRRLERAAPSAATALARSPSFTPLVNGALGLAVMVVLALVPSWAGYHVQTYVTALLYVIIFLSLSLLTKTSGLVSLCQISFAAVGAITFAHLTSGAHVPWLLGLVGAAAVAGVVGSLLALTAIRLSGVFFALATLAFGYILQQLVYPMSFMFGNSSGSLQAPRPSFARGDAAYYFVVAVALALCVGVALLLVRTRLGRLLRGIADSPLALQVQGCSVLTTKLTVFGISAAMAGLAGALFAGLQNYVTPSSYSAASSLTLMAVVFVIPLGEPWDALAAAAVFYLLPAETSSQTLPVWIQLGFGLLAVATVVVVTLARRTRRARHGTATAVRRGPVGGATGLERRIAPTTPAATGLEARDVTVRFGGLVALDGVDLDAPMRAVTGLVGPNGAGKTTLFNVCCGMVRPTGGRVLLHGEDISRRTVAGRARRGLGRTFQRPELFTSLAARDAVALGREAALAGGRPWHHVLGRSGADASGTEMFDEAIELSGVARFADVPVAQLSTAQCRLVELGRCLSGGFDVLLLDEPTAGLDADESRSFAETLRRVVDARGIGVLVVEHDMSVVLSVCDRVTVLDFGTVLFEGTPSEMMGTEAVRAAYLGSWEPPAGATSA